MHSLLKLKLIIIKTNIFLHYCHNQNFHHFSFIMELHAVFFERIMFV